MDRRSRNPKDRLPVKTNLIMSSQCCLIIEWIYYGTSCGLFLDFSVCRVSVQLLDPGPHVNYSNKPGTPPQRQATQYSRAVGGSPRGGRSWTGPLKSKGVGGSPWGGGVTLGSVILGFFIMLVRNFMIDLYILQYTQIIWPIPT